MLSHPVRLFVLLLVLVSGCDGRCSLEPAPGPCRAYFPRAFFNPATKRCESFVWGGCDGVVPFDTVKECQQVCGG
ncbi:MAG: BPTI/Kunitz domain-containing protein [Archangium sp.]|nr:BPTI/Kunitz domain-containing protein [Archangium sp.]